MTQAWIVMPTVAALIVTIDLVATYLRKRARRIVLPSSAVPTEEKVEDRREEAVARHHD